MIDWDYWPYLWLVHEGEVAIKDFNGWLVYTGQQTLGV
ncbi:hypothetical protein EVB91_204 [Rhizobium phage RHph_I1_18]|nr:hypothetical protein EVB91_204 [Rhizobium phage RHph_I1_18]